MTVADAHQHPGGSGKGDAWCQLQGNIGQKAPKCLRESVWNKPQSVRKQVDNFEWKRKSLTSQHTSRRAAQGGEFDELSSTTGLHSHKTCNPGEVVVTEKPSSFLIASGKARDKDEAKQSSELEAHLK